MTKTKRLKKWPESAELLRKIWLHLGFRKAQLPPGGTRMKGSGGPSFPPCGRAAGVARNLRQTEREGLDPFRAARYVP
jgi:hypothetical protein